MSALYLLIPVSVLLAAGFVLACLLAIRGGQFDDIERPKWRMLFEDPGLNSIKREENGK